MKDSRLLGDIPVSCSTHLIPWHLHLRMSFDCRILLRVPSGRHCINRTIINQQLPDLTINIAVFASLKHQHRCLRKSQALLDKLQTYNRQNRHLNKLQLRSVWLLFTPQNSHQQQTSLPPNSTRQPPHLRTDHSQHNNKTPPFLCDPLSSHQVDGLHYPYNPPILPCGLYILVRPIGMRT
jgi:hypothetical protein